jgi:phage terminase large subunit GpA-like protein
MLIDGEWRPQSIPENRKRRSYHSPGLISPFLPWERICQDFIETDFGQDLLKFKDFTINVLGNPWAAVKKAAQWEKLKARAEDYSFGEIPKGELRDVSGLQVYYGPLLLYAGCDVQGDRLEMMVTGFGPNGEKWVVDYKIFYGNTSDIGDPCWGALHDHVYNHQYLVCTKNVTIGMCAVDSGFNPRKTEEKRNKDYIGKAHIVYEFVSLRQDRFMAIMGSPDDKAIGIMKESKITDVNTTLTKRYMVSVSLLKESLMDIVGNSEGFNTIHVPMWEMVEGVKKEIQNLFYQGFLSERWQENSKKPGTYHWFAFYKRNEPLDTYNYSIAAATAHNIPSMSNQNWSTYYFRLMG